MSFVFKILKDAKKKGATAAEVNLFYGNGFSVTVRNSEVETIEHNNGKSLTIVVYFGYCTGSATTCDFSSTSIDAALSKACYIAKFTTQDSCSGLADRSLLAYEYPDLDLYHTWSIEIPDAISMMRDCEKFGLDFDKRIINSEGASLDNCTGIGIYANSNDFYGITKATKHTISCSFIAKSNDVMQRDHYYTVARDAKDLKSIYDVATFAARRSVDRLGARRIPTCVCPVLFSTEVANSLIRSFNSAISGENIYRKSSFLLDCLNKQVFSKHVTLIESPLIPKYLGSAAFDDEGVKLNASNLVVDGILQRYLLDSYCARKLNMKTTGNAGGVHNLFVNSKNSNDLDLIGLIRKMGSGLFVTEIMGNGVNIVTGDYSRGVFGYWIENGTIQYPVIGATIAGNLKDMLLNIIAIGNDIDYRGSILTGSILIDSMVVTGN